ncbi:hypothetical protein [Haloferax sp. YSMS24]|uniref:hypothetical protein n=1 Tax=Haloferax sp. YSMS24 TaxID=3388425 RepID=UPI00398CA8A4
MNVLPWLLDWPPHPLSIVLFLLVTAFSVGTLVLFGGVVDDASTDEVTIDAVDVSVRLNDEVQYPDTENGSIQTCLASGTPGDSVSILGDVTVDIPHDFDTWPLVVDVRLAPIGETSTTSVDETGTQGIDIFWLVEDDETLSVGDTATLQVRVRADGETITDSTRELTVQNDTRTYDCDQSLAPPTGVVG